MPMYPDPKEKAHKRASFGLVKAFCWYDKISEGNNVSWFWLLVSVFGQLAPVAGSW